ncbi:MAG: polysaccharide pyruvyl transferase family protein [Ruminococcaceae bacterium]|nr:polysaccharide pyruvyl transferase family protein [Oscillospiraceae bacterium]
MLIGILSMQRICNYGSFLQALSLKMQFETLGHEVHFIDIEPGRQIVQNKVPTTMEKIVYLCTKIFNKEVITKAKHYFFSKKMEGIHQSDFDNYLDNKNKENLKKEYDLVIIGSDEVFNCCTASAWGFSKQLLGDVKNARHVVTYAASCGSTDYHLVCKYDIKDEVKSALDRLEAISVRDENTFDFVKQITGKKPVLHLDPVFLSDFPEASFNKPKKPYLLVYAYSNRISDKNEIKRIKEYARKNHLDILCVGQHQAWCKKRILATGLELLQYVKHAEAVITDTFHGTVFSIKFNKQFGTIVRDSNYNKLYGLLKTFALTERMLTSEDYSNVMDAPIDFDKANALIDDYKQKAFDYFEKVCAIGRQ